MKPSLLFLVAVLGLFGCTQPPEPVPGDTPPVEAEKSAPESPEKSPTTKPPVVTENAPPGGTAPPAETEPSPEQETPPRETPPRGLLNLSPEYKEAMALHGEASKALREGNTRKAEDLLDRVLALQPHDLRAVMTKARICREDGRYSEAVDVLDRASEAGRTHVSILYEKALALHGGGDSAAALEQLYLIFERDDRVPDARYLRAIILAEDEDRDGTLAALEDAVDNGFLGTERLESEEHFAFIRDDDRFKSLVSELRADREERKRSARGPSPGATTPLPMAPPIEDAQPLLVDLEYVLGRTEGYEVPFDFVGTDGKPLRLTDHPGKAVMVTCWTPGLRDSVQLLEDLMRLQGELGDEGLQVLTLCRDAHPEQAAAAENVRSYLKSFKVDLPTASIRDADAGRLRVGVYPSTIFVGRNGKVYMWISGRLKYNDLARLARVLLRSSPKEESEPEPEGERSSGTSS